MLPLFSISILIGLIYLHYNVLKKTVKGSDVSHTRFWTTFALSVLQPIALYFFVHSPIISVFSQEAVVFLVWGLLYIVADYAIIRKFNFGRLLLHIAYTSCCFFLYIFFAFLSESCTTA